MFLLRAAAITVAVSCASHAQVKERLERDYGETVQSAGINSHGNLMEVWASEAGTWTITLTRPHDMIACIMATGENFDGIAGTLTPTGIAL